MAERVDYRNPESVNEGLALVRLPGLPTPLEREVDGKGPVEVETVALDGTVYRGDTHTMSMLRQKPTFFGDYESVSKYLQPGSFLKTYETKRPLRLLNLSPSSDNVRRIRDLFDGLLGQARSSPETEFKIRITFLMLEVAYGMVDGTMDKLDLMDLDPDAVVSYLRREYGAEDQMVARFAQILGKYRRADILPSRCSLRRIDKALMANLRDLLSAYHVDGIWYSEELVVVADGEPRRRLCIVVNEELYGETTDKLTCVPSEIGIFSPADSLRIVKMQRFVNGELVEVSVERERRDRGRGRHRSRHRDRHRGRHRSRSQSPGRDYARL